LKLNPRQTEAIQLLNNPEKTFYLLYGAARSGKTMLICRYYILTAIKYPGCRLLLGRFRFNHAKLSVWVQTLMPLVKEMLPIGSYEENRTDWILKIGDSEIWLAGFDDKERAEKILSMEFARIAIIEMFQISFEVFEILRSRLNSPRNIVDQKGNRIATKMIGDGNPRGKKHWTYRVFLLGVHPQKKGEEIKKYERYANMKFRTEDNEHNLSDGYIENNLDSLSGVRLKRLRYGDFADEVEGGVYKFDRAVNHVDKIIEYDPNLPIWTGWDFGIASDQFIFVAQVAKTPMGPELRIINEYVENNKDYMHYRNWLFNQGYNMNGARHAGDPAGRSRDAKLESWFSLLDSVGIQLESPSRKFRPADMIDGANRIMQYVRINETQCPDMVEMFENWAFPQDKDGAIKEGVLPEHNKFSHPGTAFYYTTSMIWPPRKIRYSVSEI